MNRLTCGLIVTTLTLASAMPALAQAKRMSPHETISTVIDRNRVMIVYGRPYTVKPGTTEVRKIWGDLIPFGKVWRTGADEATLLITQKPIAFGDTTVPAGCYTLFTLPNEDGTAKLIINKQIGQWGLQYDPKQDFARVDLTKDSLDTPVDQFTMAIKHNPAGGGIIEMSWESTKYSVGFTLAK